MATVPEYGTLGFNRGRAMNEPMSREQYERNVFTTSPSLVGDDPIMKMQESHLTAGAVGYAIGMLGIVVLVIWNLL